MNLDQLQKIAEAVTEPAWAWANLRVEEDGYVYNPACSYLGGTAICLADTYEGSGNDSLFLQTFHAATVLRLIAVARAAKYVSFSNGFDAAYPDKLAALRSALEELEGA